MQKKRTASTRMFMRLLKKDNRHRAPVLYFGCLRARALTLVCTISLSLAAKIYGLHSHPGDPSQAIQLAAGEMREVQFDAGEPGTYMYWATTSDAQLDDPERRQGGETLLTGAFIVDPREVRDDDRIFVIEEWER